MKQLLSSVLLGFALVQTTHGVVSSGSVTVNSVIPDGDFNGIQSSLSLSGIASPITDVNVTLTISGGFNGDFYAYLFHNGSSAILLNRVGRTASSGVGYPDAGFGLNASSALFTFDDQGGQDAHLYRTFPYTLNGSGQLTGTWQADGRAIDPLSAGSVFDSALRSNLLNVFNGADPNGTWSLYVADVSSGGEGTLVNWGLDITTVPEPGPTTLLILACACVAFTRMRTRFGSSRGNAQT
jgi:subtilisin-like proprotein convertase family protein